MITLARTRRPRRKGEWTEHDAVTFIVTLAARRNVTLAARAAGKSRKAAYALRARDPGFAWAWDAAFSAGRQRTAATAPKGDKADRVHNPPVQPRTGDSAAMPQDFSWYHELLAQWRGESPAPQLAAAATLS